MDMKLVNEVNDLIISMYKIINNNSFEYTFDSIKIANGTIQTSYISNAAISSLKLGNTQLNNWKVDIARPDSFYLFSTPNEMEFPFILPVDLLPEEYHQYFDEQSHTETEDIADMSGHTRRIPICTVIDRLDFKPFKLPLDVLQNLLVSMKAMKLELA